MIKHEASCMLPLPLSLSLSLMEKVTPLTGLLHLRDREKNTLE